MTKNRKQRRAEASGKPKYADAVLAAALMTDMQAPGVYSIRIEHDDWCDLLNNRGECNCNPDVFMPQPVEQNGNK